MNFGIVNIQSPSILESILVVAAFALSACAPQVGEFIAKPPPKPVSTINLSLFNGEHIGRGFGDDKPWIAHVRAIDLDQDGRMDIIGCEAKGDEVVWLRQLETGEFQEIVIGSDMHAPVHVEAYDLDADNDIDVLVSSMSIVFPNNDKIGSLIVLENDGSQNFRQRVILENVERVTDARAGDLDGDGDLDLAVGQFGYDQGEVRWMRNDGDWNYRSEILLRLSGVINVTIDDYDGDGSLDIAAIFSQQWEEIHLFLNDGKGHFSGRPIWGSTNEDYAVSGMSSADINLDGRPDLVFSNGDGFGPNPVPGPRPWHGIQWLENIGSGNFSYHRIGDLGGAYSPVAADFDRDGDIDIAALSSFNDWTNPQVRSLVLFQNEGSGRFALTTLAHDPIQMVSIDAAAFGEDEDISIVSGGFHAYWPFDRMSRFMIWRQNESE
ncbi:MAG: hypothetical protein ACI92G_000256 [Candidatus Pelagisphaera sp.]|jgi:hypothetical protein